MSYLRASAKNLSSFIGLRTMRDATATCFITFGSCRQVALDVKRLLIYFHHISLRETPIPTADRRCRSFAPLVETSSVRQLPPIGLYARSVVTCLTQRGDQRREPALRARVVYASLQS